MKKLSMCIYLFMVLLVSCRPLQPASATVQPLPDPEMTHTPVPSMTSIPTEMPTITPTLTPSPIENLRLQEIEMMNETSGWAWAVDQIDEEFIFYTSDEGLTWVRLMPQDKASPESAPYIAFFLDAQTAWVMLGNESLLRTLDGGQSWEIINQNLSDELEVPYHDWYKLSFVDTNHGWLVAGYSAAGAHEFYYETQDGGLTWHPLNFETWPAAIYNNNHYKNELAFWTMIDVIYIDSSRFILAPGEQKGTLKMFLSTDRGSSWKTVQLLPSEFPDQSFNPFDRKISQPFFFDPQNGVLTVSIWASATNTTQFLVYETSDGGLTWSLKGGPTSIKDVRSEFSFLSARDAILLCGVSFCVTSDGGNTWSVHSFGTDIPTDIDHSFLQLDFVNPATGWLLIKANDEQGNRLTPRLLKTTDGGLTWMEMTLVLSP